MQKQKYVFVFYFIVIRTKLQIIFSVPDFSGPLCDLCGRYIKNDIVCNHVVELPVEGLTQTELDIYSSLDVLCEKSHR